MKYFILIVAVFCGYAFCEKEISISSSHTIVQEFSESMNKDGKKYDRCYIIVLKGEFPQKELQLKIGTQVIENITVTKKNIRFTVYEKRILHSFENLPFSCYLDNELIYTSAVKFHVNIPTQRNNIRIKSCNIKQKNLRKPFVYKNQKYNSTYVVTIKGDFPLTYATVLDVYVGDYKIEEYGGANEGIYFRIYDSKLLQQLDGQLISYGYDDKKWNISSVKLDIPSQLRDTIKKR